MVTAEVLTTFSAHHMFNKMFQWGKLNGLRIWWFYAR
jgi:hypothetical protein